MLILNLPYTFISSPLIYTDYIVIRMPMKLLVIKPSVYCLCITLGYVLFLHDTQAIYAALPLGNTCIQFTVVFFPDRLLSNMQPIQFTWHTKKDFQVSIRHGLVVTIKVLSMGQIYILFVFDWTLCKKK